MESLFLRMYGDHGLVDSLDPKRCSEKTTSSAVSGSPLWNLMSLRMLNVQVSPSGLRSYLSATLPITLPCWSKVSNPSYRAQPHPVAIMIGATDSWPKSALANRKVPLGAAAELAGAWAVVGFAALVGAAAGAAAA